MLYALTYIIGRGLLIPISLMDFMDTSGFYKLTPKERLGKIKEFCGLSEEECGVLSKSKIGLDLADKMIENVVGTLELPFGIATNFVINGKEYLIPMVIEESSVVAGASKAAKLSEGFVSEASESIMIGQILLIGVDFEKAKEKVEESKKEIIRKCNERKSSIIELGGGVKGLEVKKLKTDKGHMVVLHFYIDVKDSMGANFVNTTLESIAPYLEDLIGGEIRMNILSNLSDRRMVKVKAVWKGEKIGKENVNNMLDAYEFAKHDPYRAATNNKGAMNGIDAVCIATGNDFRALEAGAHAYASKEASYTSMTRWEKKGEDLLGYLEMPLAVGIVGGYTNTNPITKIALKILGVKSAKELAEIIGAVGLANNFAAMYALVTEGIQKGHMRLHAKNVALNAGAKGEKIDKIAEQMIKEGKISELRAKEILHG